MGDALQGFVGQVVMHDTIDDGKRMSGSAHIETAGGVLLDELGNGHSFLGKPADPDTRGGGLVLVHDLFKDQPVIVLVLLDVLHQHHRLEPLAHLASGSMGDQMRFMVADAGHIGQRTDGAIVPVGDAGVGICADDLGLDGGHGLVGWVGISDQRLRIEPGHCRLFVCAILRASNLVSFIVHVLHDPAPDVAIIPSALGLVLVVIGFAGHGLILGWYGLSKGFM